MTSPPAVEYNCIAWAVGDTENWWQPGDYWPIDSIDLDFTIEALRAAFLVMGFEVCDDPGPEEGFGKVALYGKDSFYTHAARQLPGGTWTSKLGKAEDIEHDTPDVVAGGLYGDVVVLMRRRSATGQGAGIRS